MCQAANPARESSESFSTCRCLTSPHRIRGAPRTSGSSFFPISSSGTSMVWQLVSYVPCDKDEPTRPLRGHPSSTRKGGALYHVFLFPHLCLAGIVRAFYFTRPLTPLGSSPEGERLLTDFLIWHEYGLAISLVCAL